MCIPFAHGVRANDVAMSVAMSVDILRYREAYGYGVRDVAERAHVTRRHHGAALNRTKGIQNISDAILSSRHDCTRERLLASYDALLSGH